MSGFCRPDTFAITAQIYFWDPTRRREETGKTRGALSGGAFYAAHDQPGPADPPLQPVFYAGGGSSAYNRAKFLALGGFDDIYHPFYVEDADLSYRAWKRGWPTLLSIDSVVYHKHRGTIGRRFEEDYIANIVRRNNFLFVWKNASDARILLAQAFVQPTMWLDLARRGRLNIRPFRLAVGRLPMVVHRIWQERRLELWSDRYVCRVANDLLAYTELVDDVRPMPSDGRLKIAFLSPYAPFPPSHGGAVRMYNVLKRLAVHNDVTLITYTDTEEEAIGVRRLADDGVEVIPIVRCSDLRPYNPFGPDPLCRVEFDTPPMRRAVKAVLERGIDVLQIDYTQMAHFVRPSRHYLTVLTEHDVTFLSQYRYFQSLPWSPAKLVAWVGWLKMFNYEPAICARFDLLLTVTEREEHFLRSYLPQADVSSAAPTGVDVSHYAPRDGLDVIPNTILFVGYLRHAPNVNAVLHLARDIFPRIRAINPAARLTIVGAHPPPEVRELGRDPSITVTGFVDDIRAFYKDQAVFVAPIRIGAGVRVKILEAMAAGIPVVTTRLGAEGIRCEPGRDITIADDSADFAGQVCTLLADPHRARAIARNGRQVVEAHYSWDAIVDNLEDLYNSRLARKRQKAGLDLGSGKVLR